MTEPLAASHRLVFYSSNSGRLSLHPIPLVMAAHEMGQIPSHAHRAVAIGLMPIALSEQQMGYGTPG